MDLTIYQPVGFNEAGGRPNNEDCIFPAPGTATLADRLFLVCDGVGGEHKGEVASALACEEISRFFENTDGQPVTGELVRDAVAAAHGAFVKAEANDPETKGMATTMTLLHLHDGGAAVAHLGDSRIYQVRQGKIIYQTKDHKWVNELVESGVITEEQAREHPKRNVITRVITASRLDQPDYMQLTDVQPDDYFFLCTDGVLEQIYDELLEYHLRNNPDNHPEPSEILEAIRAECADKTRDNFSAYLIRVRNVAGKQTQQEPVRISLPVNDPPKTIDSAGESPIGITAAPRPRSFLLGLAVFGVIFGLMLLLYFLRK